MKPPFRYYGSKVRMADLICRLMPPHRVYVEPFAGSLSVFFAKPVATHEVVNDLSLSVVRFLRVLRDQPEQLQRVCQLTPHSRYEFEQSLGEPGPEMTDLEAARRFWVRVNQGFNGLAVRAGWATSVAQHTNRARSSANIADRLLECAGRLRGVTIECLPGIDVVRRYDCVDAVIYCDPPYVESTRSDRRKRPSGDYDHEMTDDDHRDLAAILDKCDGTVILSGYQGGLYDELYAGWHRQSIDIDRPSTRGTATGVSTAQEVLWSNRPFSLEQLAWRLA